MGAVKGNKNALGNRGNKQGRKSAFQEASEALWHEKTWASEQDVEALSEKIKGRVYSGRDMAAYMLLNGNSRIVGKFLDKMLPNLERLVDKDGKDVLSVDELAQRIANIRAKKK